MIFLGKKVEDEIEAYLLGFLYADGSINTFEYGKYRVLSIALSEKDKIFLQMICDIFNKELNKNYTIKYQKKSKSFRLTISNSDIIQRLIKLGITPNKTYENNSFVFDNVPISLKIPFIRGFFDGDGTLYYTSQKQFGIGFVSLNEMLLKSICNFLYDEYNLNLKVYCEKEKYYRINSGGNRNARNFTNIIYKNASIYLKRKYSLYKKIPPETKKYKYKGLAWYKRNKKFGMFIYVNIEEQKRYLGLFETEEEAVKAYNVEAIKLGKETQTWKGNSVL